jgi:exosortase
MLANIKMKKDLIAYVAIALLLVLLTWPALVWLWDSWLGNPYYSHGLLIPPVAAFLAWRQYRKVRQTPRQGGSWVAVVVAVLALASVLWTMLWQNYTFALLAALVLLAAALVYLEGWRRMWPWAFPWLLLAISIPLPFIDSLSPWMESFTAGASASAVRLLGVNVVQRGSELSLPGTTFIVGAPCSGMRSLVAMATLGLIWVYLVQGRAWAKGIMLAAILPLVLVSNGARVAIILALAHFSSVGAALTFHEWSSPVLFVIALGLLVLLGRTLGCYRLREDIF